MSYAPSGGAATARQTRFPAWAFYGVLFGILGALSILAWGPIGVSGTYPRFIGEILELVAPSYPAPTSTSRRSATSSPRGRPSS